MLDSLTPGEFSELMAADILDPDPQERIAEILKLVGASQAWSKDVTPEDFEPKRQFAEDEPLEFGESGVSNVSPDLAAAKFAVAIGRPPDRRPG